MSKKYTINITNGVAEEKVLNGEYAVTANVLGYDNSTITPSSINVTDTETIYNFTIAAKGVLTLHVSEDGTVAGVPIVGATFVRVDAEGNQYGNVQTSDDSGNVVFSNLPVDANGTINVYFKQLSSDGDHEFSSDLITTTLVEETNTHELINAAPKTRSFNLVDSNYDSLVITTGELTLDKNE